MLRQGESGWSNPRVLSLFAVIFLCGLAIGTAGASLYFHARFSSVRAPLTVDVLRKYGLERLQHQLNLTPEQVKTVMKELDDYAKYYENIEEERTDVAEHGRKRILDVLTSEQRKKFNAMFNPAPR